MTKVNTVFFIFNQEQADHLESLLECLDGIDTIVSVIPGVSLERLVKYITCLTIEQALEKFAISQRMISDLASGYARDLLSVDVTGPALRVLGLSEVTGIPNALKIQVWIMVHNAFAFELLFNALSAQGMRTARCFAFHGQYRMVERLDIKTMLHVELGFGPQLQGLCRARDVVLQMVPGGCRTAPLRDALRNLLLSAYKFKALLSRSFTARGKGAPHPCDAVFVVRAQTEVASAEPLLRWRAERGMRDCLLVDDLIKSPNGTLAARQSGFAWYPLHAFLSPGKLFMIFLETSLRAGRAARLAFSESPERMAKWGFLGQSSVACAVLRTTFMTVPELKIFYQQLFCALTKTQPSALVSFDTVDRWGTVQGALARSRGLRSVMVQNTAVDDIEYPCPLSMDHLVVGNERLRRIFLASGAPADRVHAVGLPLQDQVLKIGDERIAQLRTRAENAEPVVLRILVATQPFVQAFDYNGALLADLVEALKTLDFPFTLVLKPHPREVIDHYRTLVDTLTRAGFQVSLFEQAFETALDAADIVLSRTSTSIEFAVLGGVPTIAYLNKYPAEIIERLDYLRDPVTVKAFDVDALREALAGFHPQSRVATLNSYSARRDAYLAEYFPGRGLATEYVAALIAGSALPVDPGIV